MNHKEYIIPIGEEAKDFDEMFIGVIRKQPELIRCEECIHHHGYICDRLYGFPYTNFQMMQDTDYCSRGERKDNG